MMDRMGRLLHLDRIMSALAKLGRSSFNDILRRIEAADICRKIRHLVLSLIRWMHRPIFQAIMLSHKINNHMKQNVQHITAASPVHPAGDSQVVRSDKNL
jgi:hypothetical protein